MTFCLFDNNSLDQNTLRTILWFKLRVSSVKFPRDEFIVVQLQICVVNSAFDDCEVVQNIVVFGSSPETSAMKSAIFGHVRAKQGLNRSDGFICLVHLCEKTHHVANLVCVIQTLSQPQCFISKGVFTWQRP